MDLLPAFLEILWLKDHPRMPRLVNSSPVSVRTRPGHRCRLHTMKSDQLTYLLRLSQQQQYMCDVESLQPSAQPQMAPFRFWNVWEPRVSGYMWAPMLMAHPARRSNTGRTAPRHTPPRTQRWPVAPHLAENPNNQVLNKKRNHLKALRTIVLPRKFPGHSRGAELS